MKTAAIALAALAFASSPVHATPKGAAGIRIEPCAPETDFRACAAITITGTIVFAQGAEFLERTKDIVKAAVSLNSPGGNLFAGMSIGETIHRKQFGTIVPDHAICMSACAFAWAAGVRRLMGNDAMVGFHVAFQPDDATHSDGQANVFLGMYLAHVGYSYDDVSRLFGHDPSKWHVTYKDAAGAIERKDMTITPEPTPVASAADLPTTADNVFLPE
jgi:hypothetical protein